MFKSIDQFIHVFLWIKAQSVHTSIEFDMNREACYAFLLSGFDERIKESETINFRLKIIIEERLEG